MSYSFSVSRFDNARRRLLLVGAAVLVLLACEVQAAVPTQKVRFYMNMGLVEIELYGNESPLNVANFLSYVDSGAYDNSFIHRTRSGSALFAQGGSFKVPVNPILDQNPIIPGPQVVNEFNAANGLTNKAYSLSAARSTNINSATSGWFINQTNNSAGFDPGPYTVLGQVTLGTSIIDAIPFLPNSPGLSGSLFTTMPIYNGDLVIIHRAARIPILVGDYNLSGSVTEADYNTWRAAYGTTSAAADGNGDGIVDAADYTVWRNMLPAGGGGIGLSAPEPTAAGLAFAGAAVLAAFLPRRVTTARRARP